MVFICNDWIIFNNTNIKIICEKRKQTINMDMLPKVQNLVGPIQVIVPNDSTA